MTAAEASVAVPSLLIGGDHEYPWVAGRVIRVGRDHGCDVVIDDRHVAPVHFQVEAVEEGWLLQDAGTPEGTWIGGLRVRTYVVKEQTTVAFGMIDGGPTIAIGLAAATSGTEGPSITMDGETSSYTSTRGLLTIGRSPGNDVPLTDDLQASLQHAELRGQPDGTWEIRDLGSHTGTFVNGKRVGRAVLHDNDVLSIGTHAFRFAAGSLQSLSVSDDVSLEVAGINVTVDGNVLVDGITFSMDSRSVLAIVGPSGSGKSTLLRALNGFSAPTSGRVQFAGRDVYESYDEMRARIGYVPQDDLVHPSLTVRNELSFAASLRLTPDISPSERQARVDHVVEELGLTERGGLQIEKLSGGQRKRVSVGIELLTQPALLFLDEPTSGLDPGNEHQVMSVLRELADGGRIVVVVTHATQSLNLVDRALFLTRGGRMAYFGPPDDALRFFARHGVDGGYAAIFHALEEPDAASWAETFRGDPDYVRFVPQETAAAPVVIAPRRSSLPAGRARQFRVLCRRQVRILAGDRRTLLTLIAQAPAFGIIVFLLFPKDTLATANGPFAALLEWLLVISATWLGTSNTIREIVKEAPIYRRERAVGLSSTAYLSSKFVVFGSITLVQTWIVVFIGLANQSLPARDNLHVVRALEQHYPNLLGGLRSFNSGSLLGSQLLEVLIAVSLTGLAAAALGLLISAHVGRAEQAAVLLPIVLVLQMAISLPMLRLDNSSKVLGVVSYFSSANWGVTALASTTSLNQLMTGYLGALNIGTDVIRLLFLGGVGYGSGYTSHQLTNSIVGFTAWKHTPGAWLTPIGVLAVMIAAFLGLSLRGLKRHELGRHGPSRKSDR